MSFDILDAINDATKEADAFENHPIGQLSLEEKLLYLQGLALVMNVDGDIDANELEYIRILIKSVGLEESVLDDMNSFAQAPDKDTIQAFFRTYRRRPIAQLFLFDALMMTRRDGKVDDKEKAVIDKMAQQLEVLTGTQRDIFDLFCHIKNKNWQESALYFSSHLLNPEHFKHLLDYHEVDGEALLAETQEIRAKRLLQLFAAKMPEIDLDTIEGDFVKPSLDHDLVMPMLQAEIDRGNAEVVNDKMTIKDATELGELDLMALGFGWDKEHCALISVERQEVSDTSLISYFVNFAGKLNAAEQLNLLTNGKASMQTPAFSEDKKSMSVFKALKKSFPYITIDNCVYAFEEGRFLDRIYNYRNWWLNDSYEANESIVMKYSENDSDHAGTFNPISEEQQAELLEKFINDGIPRALFKED